MCQQNSGSHTPNGEPNKRQTTGRDEPQCLGWTTVKGSPDAMFCSEDEGS